MLFDYKYIFPPEFSNELQTDSVFIFPTETLYGIGCSIESERAIARIFEIKGRASNQPPPVLIVDQNQLNDLVESIPQAALLLMKQFWPGSLTLILPARKEISNVICGFDEQKKIRTIGVRQTAHPFAAALCTALAAPIIATSANFSGAVGRAAQPKTLGDIPIAFQEMADGVLNGGEVGGAPSTIVDCVSSPPCVLRAGAIALEELQKFSRDIYAK